MHKPSTNPITYPSSKTKNGQTLEEINMEANMISVSGTQNQTKKRRTIWTTMVNKNQQVGKRSERETAFIEKTTEEPSP